MVFTGNAVTAPGPVMVRGNGRCPRCDAPPESQERLQTSLRCAKCGNTHPLIYGLTPAQFGGPRNLETVAPGPCPKCGRGAGCQVFGADGSKTCLICNHTYGRKEAPRPKASATQGCPRCGRGAEWQDVGPDSASTCRMCSFRYSTPVDPVPGSPAPGVCPRCGRGKGFQAWRSSTAKSCSMCSLEYV